MRLPCYNSIVLSLVSQSEPYHFGGVLSIVRQWMAGSLRYPPASAKRVVFL